LISGTSPNVLLDTSAVIDFEGLDGRAVAAQVPCDYADLALGIRSYAQRSNIATLKESFCLVAPVGRVGLEPTT
jgi:hypothetical protein